MISGVVRFGVGTCDEKLVQTNSFDRRCNHPLPPRILEYASQMGDKPLHRRKQK